MIVGVGIDSVEIKRFEHWHTYNQKQLLRAFGQSEIEYCLANPTKSAERFAVRFAAREALFKAISAYVPAHTIPFLTVCRATTIIKKPAPEMQLNWSMLEPFGINNNALRIHLSMTHTQQIATTIVILELL